MFEAADARPRTRNRGELLPALSGLVRAGQVATSHQQCRLRLDGDSLNQARSIEFVCGQGGGGEMGRGLGGGAPQEGGGGGGSGTKTKLDETS